MRRGIRFIRRVLGVSVYRLYYDVNILCTSIKRLGSFYHLKYQLLKTTRLEVVDRTCVPCVIVKLVIVKLVIVKPVIVKPLEKY